MNPERLLSLFETDDPNPLRFGRVSTVSGGRPRVVLDGDVEAGARTPRLSSYSPSTGDRVAMVRVGRRMVILGEIV